MNTQTCSTSAAEIVKAAIAALRGAKQEIREEMKDRSPSLRGAGAATAKVSRVFPPASPDDDPERPTNYQRRMEQMLRVLMLIEILASYRHPVTLDALLERVCDQFGEVCPRTLRRDLEALQAFQLVDKVGSKWQMVSGTVRDATFRGVAELRARAWETRTEAFTLAYGQARVAK